LPPSPVRGGKAFRLDPFVIVVFLVDPSPSWYIAAATAFAQDADFYFNRGLQFARQGDMDATITDWTEAIRLNPKYTETHYNRGLAFY
jgi:tetratricopeptide (TPR) repeat protein